MTPILVKWTDPDGNFKGLEHDVETRERLKFLLDTKNGNTTSKQEKPPTYKFLAKAAPNFPP